MILAAVLCVLAGVFVILAIVSIYMPRHRIVRCERYNRIWYTPQETFVWWIFWQDMQYAVGPYLDLTYKFDTLEEARKFLDSLNEDEIKKTVVK